jgi:hypothetical protein
VNAITLDKCSRTGLLFDSGEHGCGVSLTHSRQQLSLAGGQSSGTRKSRQVPLSLRVAFSTPGLLCQILLPNLTTPYPGHAPFSPISSQLMSRPLLLGLLAVVATVELVNCAGVEVQCTGSVPTVAVDKCDGCQVRRYPPTLNWPQHFARLSCLSLRSPRLPVLGLRS